MENNTLLVRGRATCATGSIYGISKRLNSISCSELNCESDQALEDCFAKSYNNYRTLVLDVFLHGENRYLTITLMVASVIQIYMGFFLIFHKRLDNKHPIQLIRIEQFFCMMVPMQIYQPIVGVHVDPY